MNKAINHRNMRLLIILIFSILSFAFSFGNSSLKIAFAQNTDIPEITVQNKTVHRGQTFSIDVELSQNTGLISLFLTLDYDDTVMTLKNVVQGDALNTLRLTTTNVETEQGYGVKPFNILWDGKDSDNSNGTIITLIFDSSIDAPIGEYPITLTYDRQNTNTAYQTPTDITITNGIVNLITGEFEVIYKDYDGTILYQKDYNSGDIPVYASTEPSRIDDNKYSYEFIGWKGVVSEDINTLIYEADYKLTPKVHTVFYYVDGANSDPDGILDINEDYQDAGDFAFDSYIELIETPYKQYYKFYGWYEDDSFTKPFSLTKMPEHDIRLYGYFKYEVREDNIPKITLNADEYDSSHVIVSANLQNNTGLNGLVLTLDYDLSVLKLTGFSQSEALTSMVFDTTNTEMINEPNFKFFFEQAENSYETGEFLLLYFDIIDSENIGTYDVTFTYDYHHDATYRDELNELKYTMLQIVGAEVPIGEIFHWSEEIGNGVRNIDITSDTGKPINVYLEVELVTDDVYLDDNLIIEEVGKGMFVSSAYNIRLMQNKQIIQPNTTLTIKIKLTEKEQKGNIKFYYLNDNNELESKDFKIENGELVFKTDHLSNWVIFSNYGGNINKSSILFNVGMPIILALATMLYALRLRQKITKSKKEEHND